MLVVDFSKMRIIDLVCCLLEINACCGKMFAIINYAVLGEQLVLATQ